MQRLIINNRIECLDGIRGLAALWVIIGHAHMLTGFRVRFLGDPDLGVDLFILVSGFLMVFHYRLRQMKEPWQSVSTWKKFWGRRLFRIAPLYYIVLAIALLLGPAIYEARVIIDTFNGSPLQQSSRYLDQSFSNALMHITFLFGFVPEYAYRTPLPDWSIGLEMQFYLFLPLIMVLIHRIGVVGGMALTVSIGVAVALTTAKSGYVFPMPTFLPLKMHVFAAGMLMAFALGENAKIAWAALTASVLLVLIPIGGDVRFDHLFVRAVLVCAFFGVIHHKALPRPLDLASSAVGKFLGNRFFGYLGEFSYGAYLIHLLVMQPVLAYLIVNHPMANSMRWLICLIVTIPITYLFAVIGYYFVEKPGQIVGRRALL